MTNVELQNAIVVTDKMIRDAPRGSVRYAPLEAHFILLIQEQTKRINSKDR